MGDKRGRGTREGIRAGEGGIASRCRIALARTTIRRTAELYYSTPPPTPVCTNLFRRLAVPLVFLTPGARRRPTEERGREEGEGIQNFRSKVHSGAALPDRYGYGARLCCCSLPRRGIRSSPVRGEEEDLVGWRGRGDNKERWILDPRRGWFVAAS